MDTQRQKLIELMEELSLPVSKADMEKDVQNFTDDEVSDLISLYSDISEYEQGMEDYVREVAPEEYQKLVDKRDEELKKKDSEYEYDLEKAQEEEDIELDSLDIKEERAIEEVVAPVEELADAVEEIEEEVEKELEKNKTENNPQISG